MRLLCLTLSLALTLVLLGCATERPTRPVPIAKMPAVPIESPIVAQSSPLVEGIRQADGTLHFDLGATSLFEAASFDDISVSMPACRSVEQGSVEVFNHSTGEWGALVGMFPIHGNVTSPPWCNAVSIRLLSQMVGYSRSSVLNPVGTLIVRNSIQETTRARLLSYDENYHFATIRREVTRYSSLAYGNNSLYAVMGDGIHDSVLAIDLEGRRQWAHACDPDWYASAAFDGTHIWAYASLKRRLVQMDTLGHTLNSIASPELIGGLAWVQGQLWCMSDGVRTIDIAASLSRDTVISQYHFSIEPYVRFFAADTTGFIFAQSLFEQKAYRYTLSGQYRDSFSCGIRIRSITSDGESLWALHSGPWPVITGAVLLTRFTLE